MNQPKFNKSFEALYAIAMSMADECIGNKTIEARFSKLEEEYQELVEAFAAFKKLSPTRVSEKTEYYDPQELKEVWENITNEIADVLFVLLHIAHQTGEATAKELLHRSTTKMLARMNDPEYIAKV
jgi:NTP pyrophosphatase (non-canonical NTP hydrolase)